MGPQKGVRIGAHLKVPGQSAVRGDDGLNTAHFFYRNSLINSSKILLKYTAVIIGTTYCYHKHHYILLQHKTYDLHQFVCLLFLIFSLQKIKSRRFLVKN